MKNKLNLALMAIVAVMILCGFKYSNREGNKIPGDQQMEMQDFHLHLLMWLPAPRVSPISLPER